MFIFFMTKNMFQKHLDAARRHERETIMGVLEFQYNKYSANRDASPAYTEGRVALHQQAMVLEETLNIIKTELTFREPAVTPPPPRWTEPEQQVAEEWPGEGWA